MFVIIIIIIIITSLFVRRRIVLLGLFFEDILILAVTGFSDLHSVLRKSTHVIIRIAIIRVTSYAYLRWEGLAAPSPRTPPFSALRVSNPVLPTFYDADLRSCEQDQQKLYKTSVSSRA